MSVHYTYPEIRTLADVQEAIKGADEFGTWERDGGITVVGYKVQFQDTFPDIEGTEQEARYAAIRRECRGLIFDTKTGLLLSRSFEKFFNVGERESLALTSVDWEKPHEIYEKLDGSLVRPVKFGRGVRWCTKAGVTDVGMMAERFVVDSQQYDTFARLCFMRKLTPLFEFCSRQNRVVIDHPEDRLVLLAVRDNLTGAYLPYEELVYFANTFDIEIVERLFRSGDMEYSISPIIELVRQWKDQEGIVIRFDDGGMLKVKAEDYVRLHRTKDAVSSERKVVDLILAGNLDDLLPLLSEHDLERVVRYERAFKIHLDVAVTNIEDVHYRWSTIGGRRNFALYSEATGVTPLERQMVFACWDGKQTPRQALEARLAKSTSNTQAFERVRELLPEGEHSWETPRNV